MELIEVDETLDHCKISNLVHHFKLISGLSSQPPPFYTQPSRLKAGQPTLTILVIIGPCMYMYVHYIYMYMQILKYFMFVAYMYIHVCWWSIQYIRTCTNVLHVLTC